MNRFNTLQENTPYLSSYIPLPLDAIMKAGAMKQQQHDDVIGDIAKEQDILKVDADPHREGIAQQLVSKYNQGLSSIADEYLKNDNASEANRKLHAFKNQWANDQTRIGIEHSKKAFDEYAKDKQDYMKNGKYDPTIKGGYDNYAEDTPIDENGRFKTFSHQGMYTSENTFDEAKKQMGDIAKDGSEFAGMQTDAQGNVIIDPNSFYWKTSSSGEGVGEPKVVSIAKRKADSFLTTNAGRYFIDRELGFHADYRTIPDDIKQELRTRATKHLVDAAANQIGWQTKQGNEAQPIPEWMRKEALDAIDKSKGEHVFTPETEMTSVVGDSFDTDKLVKKDRSSAFPGVYSGGTGGYDGSKMSESQIAAIKDANSKGPVYGSLTPKEQEIYNGVAKNVFNVPDVSKLTAVQKDGLNAQVKGYLDNLKNMKKSSYAETIPSDNNYGGTKGADGLTKVIFGGDVVSGVNATGNFINERFRNPDNGDVISGEQFYNDVLKGLDKETKIKVVAKYNYNNPFSALTNDKRFSGAYEVSVDGKQWVMSNTGEKIRTVDKNGKVDYKDVSGRDMELADMSRAQHTVDKSVTITKPMVIGKDVVYATAKVIAHDENHWTMDIGGKHYVGSDAEDLDNQFKQDQGEAIKKAEGLGK